MAARVNVRFVAILCTIVGVVFVGMAGAAYFIVKKSASDHFATGQEYYQVGDFVEAEKAFAKAVNKERTNTVYLERWIETIEKLTPETRVRYADVYSKNYVPGLRQLAVAKRTDVDAWEKYLETIYERLQIFGAGNRSGWQVLLSETNAAIEYFLVTQDADDDQADWHRLRRYRALSNLNMRSATGRADEDFRDKTILDFEAAMRVDPMDADSAVGLYEWLMTEADRAEDTRDDPEVYLARAREVLDGFLAANPDQPRARLARVFYDLRERARGLRDLRVQSERIQANIALAAEFRPRLESVVEEVLSTARPESLTIHVAELTNRLERVIAPGAGIPMTQRVIAAAREGNADSPGDVAMLDFFEGAFLADSNEHEKAIAALERVLEAPLVPISLEGMLLSNMRADAVLKRVRSAIDLYGSAEGDDVAPALERVLSLREEVDELVPQGTPQLLLIDAQIALIQRNLADAQRLAVSYQREAGMADPEASFLLGRIYMQRNQPGQALQELERFVELSPNVPGAWAQLSSLRDRVGDRDGALEAIERAYSLAPDDPGIQRRYGAVRAMLNIERSTDPVTNLLVAVERLIDTTGGVSPKYNEAIALVLRGIQEIGDNELLHITLVRLYSMKGDNEAGIAAAELAIVLFPENESLRQLRTALRFREGEIPDSIQGIRRTMLEYRQAATEGRDDDARRLLERAETEDPNDSELLQILIGLAITERDFEAARGYVDRATALNIDQANGRILRADLLEAEGRAEEALTMIDSVIDDGLSSVPVLYRKARVLRTMGRTEDSIEVFEDILRRQPDSVANIREVVAALAQLGRQRRALEIARESQRVAGADSAFVDTWLRLEAEVGDATAAMLKREDIRDDEPANRSNNLALASVYLRLGEWAKARPLIDALRAESDDISLVLLDARWHAEQGVLARAIGVFDRYLSARRDAGQLDARDVLVYANFLQVEGQANRAIALIRGSKDVDIAEGRPLWKRLALLLFATNRMDEAVEVMDELIAAGVDDDGVLELARVESFIMSGDFDRAQSALDNLGAVARSTEEAGILAANLAVRRGDRRAAMQAISNTLATFPTSARAYVRRAELIWEDIQGDDTLPSAERVQLQRDAVGDLEEAIKHNPAAWEAHRLLGQIALEDGRYEDAARHFATTIELRPSQAPLRTMLVTTLLEQGDVPRAMTIVDRAVESDPANVDLRVSFARLLASLDQPADAIRLFESALAQRRNPEIAAQLVEFLLGLGSSSDLSRARQVLNDPNLNVDGTWQLKLMEAAVSLAEGNQRRGVLEARQSFELVRRDTPAVVNWFNTMPALIEDHPVRMQIALQLGVEDTPERVGEIMLASLMLQDAATDQQGIDDLRRLSVDQNMTIALRAGQLLGDTFYRRAQYEEAAEAWRGVVGKAPDAGQSLNNLAFVLATELGGCDEAIDLAIRAKDAPGVARTIVLSTLTVAYLACDQIENAEQSVGELVSLSRGSPEEALAAIRRGQVLLYKGLRSEAERAAESAEALINATGGRADSYRSILEDFRTELGQ